MAKEELLLNINLLFFFVVLSLLRIAITYDATSSHAVFFSVDTLLPIAFFIYCKGNNKQYLPVN